VAPIYYYAPAFTEPEGSEHGPGLINPGRDDGAGTVSAMAAGGLPPGLNALKYDDSVPRFVLAQPTSIAQSLPGWTMRTKAQVNADYPGLIP
jgi:hypothetical protein